MSSPIIVGLGLDGRVSTGVAWALVAFFLAIIGAGVAQGLATRAQTRRQRALAVGPAAFVLGVTFIYLLLLIETSRRDYMHALVTDVQLSYRIHPAAVGQPSLRMIGLLLALPLPVLLASAARGYRDHASTLRSLIAVCVFTGFGLLAAESDMMSGVRGCFSGVPTGETLVESSSLIDVVRVLVVAACFVAFLVRLHALWQVREPWQRVGLRSPVVVFAAGLLAFAGTRAHAYDRHHLVSWQPVGSSPEVPPLSPALDGVCHPLDVDPLLRLLPGGRATLDDLPVETTSLTRELEVCRRNWTMLHPAQARDRWPLTVIVSPSAPMAALLPWLRAASATHFRRVSFAFKRRRVVRSQTLSAHVVEEECGISFDLDPAGTRPAPDSTLGALLETARKRAGRSIRVEE